MKELTENLEVFQMYKISDEKATEVTAARVQKKEEELSPRDEVIEKVHDDLCAVYKPIYFPLRDYLYSVIPENNWSFNEYDEVRSLTKDASKYKGIALNESYYQVKYEILRYHCSRIENPVVVSDFVAGLQQKVLGRKSDSSSEKPYQYGSKAIRNMWYFKEQNAAVVFRVAYRDYDGNGVAGFGSYIEVAFFIYYSISEELLKEFFGKITMSDAAIEQAFNVAGTSGKPKDSNTWFRLALPIQTVSLSTTKIPKKFKEYNQLFKLPDASIISLKFTDLRSKIADFVEKATGTRECPVTLPRWKTPSEGVLYTSDGKCPDYVQGEFPNAVGKLKDNDIANYTFRVCTRKEAENRGDESAWEVPIPGDENGKTAFLIREEPVATDWKKYINVIFWTDFENSLAFYYNKEGNLQKVNIQGYQDISDNDIVRIYHSGLADTQIDLGVAIRSGGREQKWFDENPEDSEKFMTMCVDLLNHVADYTQTQGADLIEVEQMAQQRNIVSSAVIFNYIKKHPEFKELFIKFFSQVGAIDSLNNARETMGNRDGVTLAKLMELNVDYDATVKHIKELEEEHLEIAHDPNGNTPLLPKNIKNFTTKYKLFAQQAIAVSMANNQKTAILDVDMGGGKTCMMVADILNQMTKGLIKKPLIVCPNKTIAQNKREIFEKWTDKRMNVFILNTETYRNITDKGKNIDKLIEVMNKMPPNTIFMTSYNFLIRDKYQMPLEEMRDDEGRLDGYDYITKYPIPQMLLNDIGIDMVYCDESQAIKNKASGWSNAVAALSGAKIKRITSGTIIPNNPIDLFAQLRFVDPSILGTEQSFLKKYTDIELSGKKKAKSGAPRFWKEGAQKQIREQIERKGGVSIRRSMWRWNMPKLTENLHFVELTPPQKSMYEFLLTLAIEEIMKDPKLKAAYELLLQRDADDDDEDMGELEEAGGQVVILRVLSRVTGYLAAPNTSKLIELFEELKKNEEADKIKKEVAKLHFTEEDLVGPKIYKMREIIENHFAGAKTWKDKGKIIVFTERVAVAQHAYDYLGAYKSHAVWYKAGMDAELERFKSDDDIWIIVAVDKSIREGQNLQMATRMIRLDIPWTPGELNQSYARAYRNGQKLDVTIDTILCDGSMEICKYNNLISKEYMARKIISSFDEGDDLHFIPIKMNIPNIQSINRKEDATKYIAMHQRINEQEIEESKEFGEKYQNYFASGISMVGSTEDLPGSKIVYVPEVSEERIIRDDEGRVIKTDSGRVKKRRIEYDVDDIGEDLELLKGKYGPDESEDDDSVENDSEPDTDTSDDISNDVEVNKDDKKDTGLHLYFFEQDEDIYLVTFYNRTSKILRNLKFKVDPVLYVKPLSTADEVRTLGKKLAKQGYSTNLDEIADSVQFKRLMAKPKKAGALQRVKKHFIVTSDKELVFYTTRMEGQMFLATYDKVEGFSKVAKLMWFLTKNKAKAAWILNKIAKEVNITNLDELALDFKVRFKANLDIEELKNLMPSTKTAKQPEKKVEKSKQPVKKSDESEKTPESSKYNGKQIVLGILKYAKAESDIKNAYNIWISDEVGGLDFKSILAKRGCTNVTSCLKYLLNNDNKTTKEIIDWINRRRKSVVVRFMTTYRKDKFGKFKFVEPYVNSVN